MEVGGGGVGGEWESQGGKSYVPAAEKTKNHPFHLSDPLRRPLRRSYVTSTEERAIEREVGRGRGNTDRLTGLDPGKGFLLQGQHVCLKPLRDES